MGGGDVSLLLPRWFGPASTTALHSRVSFCLISKGVCGCMLTDDASHEWFCRFTSHDPSLSLLIPCVHQHWFFSLRVFPPLLTFSLQLSPGPLAIGVSLASRALRFFRRHIRGSLHTSSVHFSLGPFASLLHPRRRRAAELALPQVNTFVFSSLVSVHPLDFSSATYPIASTRIPLISGAF